VRIRRRESLCKGICGYENRKFRRILECLSIATISHPNILLRIQRLLVRKGLLRIKVFPCILTTNDSLSSSRFRRRDFKNLRELKVLSSSIDPSTKAHLISANLRYSAGIIFVSTAEPNTRSHNLVNGFLSKGGSMQPLAWAFIVTLKRDCCMSSAQEDNSSP
jgi:hypothetical protein